MRKADYATLADAIKDQLEKAHSHTATPGYMNGQIDALTLVANRFANRANVDTNEFLKACGIEQ